MELVEETGDPRRELSRIGIFETVLKLRPAYPVLDGQVLDRLQVEGDPPDLRQLRLQAANDVRRARFALGEGLQVDLDTAAVHRRVGAVDSDERGQALDGGVLQD